MAALVLFAVTSSDVLYMVRSTDESFLLQADSDLIAFCEVSLKGRGISPRVAGVCSPPSCFFLGIASRKGIG